MTKTEHTIAPGAVAHHATLTPTEWRLLTLIRALDWQQQETARVNALSNRLRAVREALHLLEQADVDGGALTPLEGVRAMLEAELKTAADQANDAAQTVNGLSDDLPTAEAELLILLGQRVCAKV